MLSFVQQITQNSRKILVKNTRWLRHLGFSLPFFVNLCILSQCAAPLNLEDLRKLNIHYQPANM